MSETQLDRRYTTDREPGFYTADGRTFLGPPPDSGSTFAPDQRELRQLLVAKLRALASDIESGEFDKKYPGAGQIRQRVDRMRDIAGAME